MLKKFLLLGLALTLGFQNSVAQKDSKNATDVGIRNLKNNLYLITGRGGNSVFTVGEDGVFLVDTQFGNMSKDIIEGIGKVSEEPIKYIINTNYQAANTGGNANFRKEGVLTISHTNTRERVRLSPSTVTRKVTIDDLPMLNVSSMMEFHLNKNDIKTFNLVNAYTDGDLAVYFEKINVLHTGDVFYNGLYPAIDFKAGGTLKGYIAGLEALSRMTDESTIVVPGYGLVGNRNDIMYTLNMINIMLKQAEKAIRAGQSEDDFAARTDLTERYEARDFGKGEVTREMFLRGVYQEVKNPNRSRVEDPKAQREAKLRQERSKG